MTVAEPYLSVVVAARNDDHGGNPLYRMQLFVDSLLEQCNRFRLPAELIVVEWNPPADRPPLGDALVWPKQPGLCAVRIIEVPNEIHSRLEHSAALPLFQMIAKNVGIRRARGEYVLATNIDLLLDDALVRRIARRGLRPHRVYRVDRYDVPERIEGPFAARNTWVRRAVIRIHLARGSVDTRTGAFYPIGNEGWLVRKARAALVRRPSLLLAVRKATGWLEELAMPLTRVAGGRGHGRATELLAIAAEYGLGAGDSVARAVARGFRFLRDLIWLARVFVYWFWCGIQEPRLAPGRFSRRIRRIWRGFLARARAAFAPAAGVAARPGTVSVTGMRRGALDAWREKRATPPLHTNACGDFTLMAREDWYRTRAYPELQQFSMHIDGLFLFQAHYAGVREHVLPYPIFHIEHGAGFRPDRSSVKELDDRLNRDRIPQITPQQFQEWLVSMRRTRAPIPFNGEDWGFAHEQFPEYTPETRSLEVAS